MPRNAVGTYSLPEPPFVTQTTISSSVMNSQLSDVANNLTTSVASTGVTPLTGGLKGLVSATVAYAFDSDLTTGFGSNTAGETYIKSAGTQIVRITATGISITGTLSTTGGYSGTLTTTDSVANFVAFEGISTEAGSSVGPAFSAYRNSASPAALDFIGSYDFNGKDSGGNKTSYARIIGQIVDPTDTSEDGALYINLSVAGVESTRITVTSSGIDCAGLVTATTGFKVGANPTATPGKLPTSQDLTSGSGATYTPPAGCTYIKVRVAAGGGGGGGTGGSAGAGGASSFNGIIANGGLPGVNGSGSTGGVGGAGGSGGAGITNLRLPGARGGDGGFSSNSSSGNGGEGGSTPFCGAAPQSNTAGYNAAASSGSGGSGAGNNGYGSGGGGAGEYFELYLSATTYIYTVGTGGAPATNGGAGAAGRIHVEEFYN